MALRVRQIAKDFHQLKPTGPSNAADEPPGWEPSCPGSDTRGFGGIWECHVVLERDAMSYSGPRPWLFLRGDFSVLAGHRACQSMAQRP